MKESLSFDKAAEIVQKNIHLRKCERDESKLCALLDKAGYIYSNGKPLGQCGGAQQIMSVYLMQHHQL